MNKSRNLQREMSVRLFTLGVSFVLMVGPWFTAAASPLSQKIHRILSTPAMKEVDIGIMVMRLNNGAEIFSLNPDKILIPASNMKLITTACALTRLKPEYRFKTVVYGDTPILKGKVKGNLYLKGFGDPLFVQEEMWLMVRHLHGLGLREVTGDLVVDDSFFDAERWGRGWGNQRTSRWYHAEISALSFNFNTIAINLIGAEHPGIPPLVWTDPPQSSYVEIQNSAQTIEKGGKYIQIKRLDGESKDTFRITGSLPVGSQTPTIYRSIRDATRYTGVSFVDFLKREEIWVRGEVRSGQVPTRAAQIHSWKSNTLGKVVTGLNRFSNNFIAESILKTMGAEIKSPPGTAAKGLEVVRRFLQEAGVNIKSLVFADGSGLSRKNRLSARALAQVLDYMYRNFEYRPEFIASLATYGVNGTLKKRKSARFIRAKTGRINGVSALSGYIGGKKDVLAFSMLMNNIQGKTELAEKIQDDICRILREYLMN